MTDSAAFLPFSRPSISPAEIAEVTACLESGWLSTGPRVKRFEEALSAYCGGREVLALSSATAGLHLALAWLRLQPGDEVITSPLTFVATLNAIVHAGGTPVMADVDPATFNLDPRAVEKKITARTRAILPVHFAGLPADVDAFQDLAERRGLRVVEDCAHAIGAEHRGRRFGSFGDVQVFSFHPNKNMTTGEGGAVATADADLADFIRRARFHGIAREAAPTPGQGGSLEYDVVHEGFKYNMMDLQAALGLHQLPQLDAFIARRAHLAARYRELLQGLPGLRWPGDPEYPHRSAWHLFTVEVDPEAAGCDRNEIIPRMAEKKVGIGLHYTAAHLFRCYRERWGFRPGDCPHAERIGARIMSLPLFPGMTEADQDRVLQGLREAVPAWKK